MAIRRHNSTPLGRADIVAQRLLNVAADRHPNPLIREIAPIAVPFIAGQFAEVLGPGTLLGSLAQGLVAKVHDQLDLRQQQMEAEAMAQEEAIRRVMAGSALDPFQFMNTKPVPVPVTGNMPGGRRRSRVKTEKAIPATDVVIDVPVEVI